jgi:HD superfamily phosphohydrolase
LKDALCERVLFNGNVKLLIFQAQMNQKKILNDPVYGFISIPTETIFELIEHPYFQRLRRIKQLGLTHYVYPGALHTRFHHALGAMHLMHEALSVLRSKGVRISDHEFESALIAILLHDIGHGPYSHALEHMIIDTHHENITLKFIELLNKEMDQKLSTAIKIFKGTYRKPFLNQLVSSQLDVDRIDYLKRDSFFTGVAEGVIGHDRIIKMLSVHEGNLVVEEKGIYSIEKYLMARRLMYWQVYLHKTVLSAEKMLKRLVERAGQYLVDGGDLLLTDHLKYFFLQKVGTLDLEIRLEEVMGQFSRLDDIDIGLLLKSASKSDDYILQFLAKGLIHRKLLRCELKDVEIDHQRQIEIRELIMRSFKVSEQIASSMIIVGMEKTEEYSGDILEIQILQKNKKVVPLSHILPQTLIDKVFTKNFICYPKYLIAQ